VDVYASFIDENITLTIYELANIPEVRALIQTLTNYRDIHRGYLREELDYIHLDDLKDIGEWANDALAPFEEVGE
jgi:hypothetical protein